jgi:hypothetical protein
MATTSVRPPSAEVVGRQEVRDPDFWLLCVAATVAILAAVQLFVYPFGRTLSEYAISGREIILGGAPAKTFWSLRAPGIALLHAAIQRTIGTTSIAARAFEVICLSLLVLLCTRLTKRIVGLERVGVLGGAVALFIHAQLEFEHTGQPEFYAVLPILFAVLLTLGASPRHGSSWRFVAIGALISLAVVFVPLFVLTLLPLVVWIWREEHELRLDRWAPLRATATAILSVTLGPVALLLWLHQRAALGVFVADWLKPEFRLWSDWSVDGFLEWLYFTADRLLLRQSALLPAGILAAFLLPVLSQEERRSLRLLLAVAAAELFAFALSYESNPGRLSGALPILSIIAGIGLYKSYRYVLGEGAHAVVAFASSLTLLALLCTAVDVAPGTYFHRSWVRLRYIAGRMPYRAEELLESDLYSNSEFNLAASRRVVARLARLRPAENGVFVQGDEPQVLWLSKQRPSVRLIRPIPEDIGNANPALEARLSQEIERKMPSVVVVSPAASIRQQPSAARRHGFERGFLLERFDVVTARDGWAFRAPKP